MGDSGTSDLSTAVEVLGLEHEVLILVLASSGEIAVLGNEASTTVATRANGHDALAPDPTDLALVEHIDHLDLAIESVGDRTCVEVL